MRYQNKKQCFFCANNSREVDYKDQKTLRRFLDFQARIIHREESGLCAKHQRKLARAIKRARFLSLLPYIGS